MCTHTVIYRKACVEYASSDRDLIELHHFVSLLSFRGTAPWLLSSQERSSDWPFTLMDPTGCLGCNLMSMSPDSLLVRKPNSQVIHVPSPRVSRPYFTPWSIMLHDNSIFKTFHDCLDGIGSLIIIYNIQRSSQLLYVITMDPIHKLFILQF